MNTQTAYLETYTNTAGYRPETGYYATIKTIADDGSASYSRTDFGTLRFEAAERVERLSGEIAAAAASGIGNLVVGGDGILRPATAYVLDSSHPAVVASRQREEDARERKARREEAIADHILSAREMDRLFG